MSFNTMPMKRIKSTVSYAVPGWNFCNIDSLGESITVSKQTCRFCVSSKNGKQCMLYDKPLVFDGTFVHKVRECCKATAGFESTIEEPQSPTIEPKTLMKQTIELYNKTINDLLNQGYPRAIAEQAAKTHILGGN